MLSRFSSLSLLIKVTAESEKKMFVYQGHIHSKDFGKFQLTRQGKMITGVQIQIFLFIYIFTMKCILKGKSKFLPLATVWVCFHCSPTKLLLAPVE